uniref:R-spondin 3 n=1 Tax=Callorhinchus milii TaxID=7868 RepID=A0A4W3ICQ0_CALMI
MFEHMFDIIILNAVLIANLIIVIVFLTANTNVGQGCPNGCDRCSEYNGCLSCKPRLFFFLERNGMRQTGVCLSSCPSGYYGIRTREMNKCTRCRADNCDTCFNKNFCTKCKAGFYLHKGRCFDICPEGFTPNNQTMELHCEVSEWSLWSPCTKRGKTCGFRKGSESRSREIVQRSSPFNVRNQYCYHTHSLSAGLDIGAHQCLAKTITIYVFI